MTQKDLNILNSLLERIDSLPDILHLRAAPIEYELTEQDNDLLLDTYGKLHDILNEVVAFINVKFTGRPDYLQAWNRIDFDTKIGGLKIITTDREHTKRAWKEGIFDLKNLIKSLKSEVTLLIKDDQDIPKTLNQEGTLKMNQIFEEKEWNKEIDNLLDKRADQADFFFDIIIEKGLINLDKGTIRKHFKKWFKESQQFDLQIKDGDFAIEDGDFQIVPDFSKDNIPEFIKWFEKESGNFIDYIKAQGVTIKKESKELIINHGNLIINKNSTIKNQKIIGERKQKDTIWTKTNVIVAVIVGIAAIVGTVYTIWFKK